VGGEDQDVGAKRSAHVLEFPDLTDDQRDRILCPPPLPHPPLPLKWISPLSVFSCISVFFFMCCSVLQCVAVCCSVPLCLLQCFCLFLNTRCSVLQCVLVCFSVLLCVAVCCSVLLCAAVCCCVLQCVAVCCNVLLCVAVCCSVLH